MRIVLILRTLCTGLCDSMDPAWITAAHPIPERVERSVV